MRFGKDKLKLRQWVRRRIWRARKWLAIALVELLYGEDMMWDVDDPEQPHYSVEDWANEVWGPATGGQETTVTFSRALSLPTRKFSIRSVSHDDSDDIDFQVTRIA